MRHRRVTTLTVLTVVIAAPFLGGCFYIPGPMQPFLSNHPGGPSKATARPRRLIGTAGSTKPFRPGAATRQQVVQRFGEPYWRTPAGDAYFYSYIEEGGCWIMLPFIPTGPGTRRVGFRFDFDADGIVRDTDIEITPAVIPHWWMGATPPLPPMLKGLGAPDTRPTTPNGE